MSIEPTCDFCGASDKFRCKTRKEAIEKCSTKVLNIDTTSIKKTATRDYQGVQYSRLVPLEAIAAAAASFEYGAKKYSIRNWEHGLSWQTMIDSLKRHVEDFERGSDYDDSLDGSGLSQVSMIMASAMMLTASVIRDIGIDDRVKETENSLTAKECLQWMQAELEIAANRIKDSNAGI